MAPMDREIPRTMPCSSAFQEKPLSSPMMMPTPALNMRAIWFGPDDDSSPKRITEDASSPTSTAMGTSACARVASRVGTGSFSGFSFMGGMTRPGVSVQRRTRRVRP